MGSYKDDNYSSSHLGEYFRLCRVKAGLTQSEVAKKLGYSSPQFISNIERGLSSVPHSALKTLITLYDVEPEVVIEKIVESEKQTLRHLLGL